MLDVMDQGKEVPSLDIFYAGGTAGILLDELGFEPDKMQNEWMWIKAHKPYYKVWPGIFDEFIATRMDIDAELLKPPHQQFAIYLPKTEDPLLSYETQGTTYYLSTILVRHVEEGTEFSDIRDIVKSKNKLELAKGMLDAIRGETPGQFLEHDLLQLRMEFLSPSQNVSRLTEETFSERGKDIKVKHNSYLVPAWTYINHHMKKGMTIEENLGDIRDIPSHMSEDGHTVPASIMEACYRLVVAVYFLATGSHKVLEQDVLSKHLKKYRELDPDNTLHQKEKKLIERMAKDKGKFGWNIGRGLEDRHLKLPRGVTYEEAVREAGGRELLYQHVRGGHWHTVRYGHGRQKQKVVWFDRTTVRPDLPPAPFKS